MKRSLWRSTDSARPRARSSTAACIEGTAVYHVGSSSSSQSKKCTWWKPGAHATEPPARREARRAVTKPWMWKSGITFRHRSDCSSRNVSATFRAETASWRCVSGTSFGRDVVPDVWRARATAPGSGLLVGDPSSGTPSRVKIPAGCDGSTWRSSTRIPRDRATSRAGVSSESLTTTARASRSSRKNSSSCAR